MSHKKSGRAVLSLERLEAREVRSVTSAWNGGGTLWIQADHQPTCVEIHPSGTNILLREAGTARTWYFPFSSISQIDFRGGIGDDCLYNYVALPVTMFGEGGNDLMQGNLGNDQFIGGPGNDKAMGYGGDDKLWGESGKDVLLGGAGNDQMIGGDGDDRLNGRAGADEYWGGYGSDVLIAIDAGKSDWVQGDAGIDIMWVDHTLGTSDPVAGLESGDKVQYVSGFANDADRSLDGDIIVDPLAKPGHVYKGFADKWLFPPDGPSIHDIRQGALNNCGLLAGLGAIVKDKPLAIRSSVVNFDDGTFGVRMGDKFYRLDSDLPVASSLSTTPIYAQLGNHDSLWVAMVEKAYAHYLRSANSYASIEWAWAVEVNKAFGSPLTGEKALQSYSSAAAMANDIWNRWLNYESVTVGFAGGSIAAGAPLVNNHMYTVYSVTRNSSNVVTLITLRNPWGFDGAGNDGVPSDALVSVTPDQIFGSTGRLNWGRV